MNLKTVFFLFTVIISVQICAQDPVYKTYDWDSSPQIATVSPEHDKYPAVVVSHHRFLEFRFSPGNAMTYFTEHKVVKVHSDAGIESYNKVAIPMHSGRELIDVRVRSVGPSGKVTNFRRENLKELENVNGYHDYKIFAVEGLAVGGMVEYIYTVKANPAMYGREIFQSDVPVLNAGFVLISPGSFTFALKSYNGLPQPVLSSYDEKRNAVSVSTLNIPALEEEEYANYRASLMRVDYRLERTPTVFNPMDWTSLSTNLFNSTSDKKGAAKVQKLLRSLDLDKPTDIEKVRALERHIKGSFTIRESGNESYSDLKSVLTSRVANERGIVKLYLACLQALGIEAELVFTSDRTLGALDTKFATPLDIRDVLLFLPGIDRYLLPALFYHRLGDPPQEVAGANGLFISYDDRMMNYSRHDFKEIKSQALSHCKLGVRANVTLVGGIPQVEQENFWQGNRAAFYRGIFQRNSGAERDEFLKAVTVSDVEDFGLTSRTFEGEDMDLSEDPTSYFRIRTNYTAASILESAGPDYLLSIGKLIGKQSELYAEVDRKLDVSFRDVSDYHHELRITVPEGFTCSGLESIRINKKVVVDGQELMYFISDYRLEGNTLIVTVNETYKTVQLPREYYPAFRDVVNSAADFNKVVVVLARTGTQ